MASSTRNCSYPGSEMVRWVNDTLSKGMEESVKRIGDLGKGIAYCQMIHLLYPIYMRLSKVKYMCLREEDRYSNFKLLEAAFQEIGTQVDIPIAKLIKCKFEDNYEFVLWFREFFEKNYYAKTEREAASQIDTSIYKPLCLDSIPSGINIIASPKVSLQSIKSIRSETVLRAIYETDSPIVYTSDGEDSSIEDGGSADKENKPHISQSSSESTMCENTETNDEQVNMQRLEELVNYWHSLNEQGDIDYEFLVSLEKIVKSWPGIRCGSFEDEFQRTLFDD